MIHIIDNVYISDCAGVVEYLNICRDVVVLVGDDLNNTVPLAIFYLMTKYGQTYEAARNFVLTKLDKTSIPETGPHGTFLTWVW